MRREDFDALVAGVAATAEVAEVIVVGSQAILGSFDDTKLPRSVTLSPEIDVVIAANPRAGSVRRLLGPGSLIDHQRGVYVDVVSEHTPHLPVNWRARAVKRRLEGSLTVAVCPEVHDLALAKLGAGRRDKDIPYVEALLTSSPPILSLEELEARLPEMARVVSDDAYGRATVWLANARKRLKR